MGYDALTRWLSWRGNSLILTYEPMGISVLDTEPKWRAMLSQPLGSYCGAGGNTAEEAINAVADELERRERK
jgi:hypothetical protein